MAKLDPIDFTIGLPINIDVNNEQSKFEVHISKKEAKIPNFRAKMGRLPLWFITLDGNNLATFHPILTFFFIAFFFETNRMVQKS